MNLSIRNTGAVEKLSLLRADADYPAAIAVVNNPLVQLKEIRHSFLHEKELNFFDTLKLNKVQHSYLLGRYAAKMALSAFMNDVIITDARIESGIFQQPVLYLAEAGNVQLSISHTTEMGIAVVFPEGHPMGVDVEAINAEQIDTIKGIITSSEKHKLHLIDTDASKSLTILWTIKEALSKVLKTGLMTPFHLYEIDQIECKGEIVVCSFINFPQYQSISWISKGHAWSVVLPKKSILDTSVIARLCL
ncbi:4'-phosphopantetheinyl transferase [Chryseobacterium sp. T16E-39]|uniref:4'-phosphopantetheinyl transferase family protein n=1 Tax=Chryseobacterium sp. T16E-39 TaxID=2015076 RepID=UPI000B5B21FA|nr:4'-phosphopantetheinyl transferase superfamily protein [Chryseobacterium sp. T16E-39]ASK28892.1 4'-phosphopantetheinyl transferase [Chryseobacterium sp. T16E-39]